MSISPDLYKVISILSLSKKITLYLPEKTQTKNLKKKLRKAQYYNK